MARTAQNSKEKRQSIITLRHEGQSVRKMSRTLKVSSNVVTKTIKHYDETGTHWYDELKCEIIGSNRRAMVRRRVGERMISACVVPTVKHGGGGVMGWRFFAGDSVCDLFRIQGMLNQHGYHSILQ